MIRLALLGLAAALSATAAAAQEAEDGAAPDQRNAAVGSDFFYSADADDTDVVRLGFDLDWLNEGPEKYRGVRVEKAWFNPSGAGWRGRERVYLRGADNLGGWKWNARLGTDGDTVLGAATIHNDKPARHEYFIERDIIETPQGLRRGLYYTFAGAAFDLPVDDRNQFTLLAGLQEFTGDNLRTHLRANYIHVVKPQWGLSAQVRARLFRNSDPREFDYYSPRWYAQLLPVVQVRRFTDSGMRYLVAGGIGAQRDSATGWRRSSYFNAQVTSPPRRNWSFDAGFLFSETPTGSGTDNSYRYTQFNLGLRRSL